MQFVNALDLTNPMLNQSTDRRHRNFFAKGVGPLLESTSWWGCGTRATRPSSSERWRERTRHPIRAIIISPGVTLPSVLSPPFGSWGPARYVIGCCSCCFSRIESEHLLSFPLFSVLLGSFSSLPVSFLLAIRFDFFLFILSRTPK